MENNKLKKIDNSKRTKCEVYTRCMGYIRPKSHYNVGKKQEFEDRINFNLKESLNSKYIDDFNQMNEDFIKQYS